MPPHQVPTNTIVEGTARVATIKTRVLQPPQDKRGEANSQHTHIPKTQQWKTRMSYSEHNQPCRPLIYLHHPRPHHNIKNTSGTTTPAAPPGQTGDSDTNRTWHSTTLRHHNWPTLHYQAKRPSQRHQHKHPSSHSHKQSCQHLQHDCYSSGLVSQAQFLPAHSFYAKSRLQ